MIITLDGVLALLMAADRDGPRAQYRLDRLILRLVELGRLP